MAERTKKPADLRKAHEEIRKAGAGVTDDQRKKYSEAVRAALVARRKSAGDGH